MSYPIYKSFQDLQDKRRLNEKNKFYPRKGLTPTKERIKELQDKGFIGDKVVENAPETETVKSYPFHAGGGYYQLSDGIKVKGKEAAEKAQEKLIPNAPQIK